MRTKVLRLFGQPPGAPRGVDDQFLAHINFVNSVLPGNSSLGVGIVDKLIHEDVVTIDGGSRDLVKRNRCRLPVE
ncbi:MAG TPA: hypothetical protein VNZ26_33085 [Vicinamibacterales bacterium]|jgi:hypothetical protein|nr:hypothetical protein [Vicinamibacterales bacterium]